MQKIIRLIATEIRASEQQVHAAIELLDGGATVPFIARYRKEVTGGLDDIQLRDLESRLTYLRELRDRREAVIKSIDEQGKLTPALVAAIHGATTKQEVEDIDLGCWAVSRLVNILPTGTARPRESKLDII